MSPNLTFYSRKYDIVGWLIGREDNLQTSPLPAGVSALRIDPYNTLDAVFRKIALAESVVHPEHTETYDKFCMIERGKYDGMHGIDSDCSMHTRIFHLPEDICVKLNPLKRKDTNTMHVRVNVLRTTPTEPAYLLHILERVGRIVNTSEYAFTIDEMTYTGMPFGVSLIFYQRAFNLTDICMDPESDRRIPKKYLQNPEKKRNHLALTYRFK